MVNLISDTDFNLRIKAVVERNSRAETIHEAFILYNDRNERKENKKYCGGCVERVYAWINNYYRMLNEL